ncbi:MAG TPA: nitroreductase/quinone reductase family protein [Solirubrobacterales bacterium]|jgi:deazaflavin-dependent oxidoreductase (nitroreductase family)|nr:nitroreductase/quinone reductase family protein [Solirubrobacterales bacterium]
MPSTREQIPAVDPTATPSALERAMRATVKTPAGTWLARVFAAKVDPWLLRHSNGRIDSGVGFPTLNLTTTGRKSGEPRTTTLLYFTRGEDVVIIASSFGRDRHPAWLLNLRNDPRAELLCRGFRGAFTAREADGQERQGLFDLADQMYGGYSRYQAKTDREIPVMVLTPSPDAPPA